METSAAVVVIDTNVLVTANNKAAQASPKCVIACVEKIAKIRQHGIVVTDYQRHILREYLNNLNDKGQPGVGDAFLKWLLTNLHNPKHCQQVHITETITGSNEFIEFPSDPDLIKFDPSDRKFVAATLSHSERPIILNATDTDWKHHENALAKHGVKIEFLCPELMISRGA